MKKLLITIAILAMATPSLAIDGELSFGYYADSTSRAAPDGGELIGSVFLEVGHRIENFRLYVNTDRLIDEYQDDFGFHPSSAKFGVGAEYQFKGGVFIKYEHQCWHPIDNGGTVEEYDMIRFGFKFGK